MIQRSTKSQITARVASGTDREVFSHETLGHFDVTSLREAIMQVPRLKPTRVLFSTLRFYNNIEVRNPWGEVFKNRDIDMDRVNELTPEQLIDPVITLLIPDGMNGPGETHLLIDGIHRVYRRKRDGKPDYWSYLIPLHLAPKVPAWAIELSGMIDPSSQWGDKEWVDGKLIDLNKEGDK